MELKRSREEIENELSEQIRLLKKSCAEFDKGDLGEWRNIAARLRIIVLGGQIKEPSLLNQAFENPHVVDSRIPLHPNNIAPEFRLTALAFHREFIGPIAPLGMAASSSKVPLEVWLDQPVIDNKKGVQFNRLSLLKAMANKQGATHYPESLEKRFKTLSEFGYYVKFNGLQITLNLVDIDKKSIRQIAHEVISSLDSSYAASPMAPPGTLLHLKFELIRIPGRRLVFQVNEHRLPGDLDLSEFEVYLPAHIALYPNIGRRQQCVCGSGRQYRNCCIAPQNFSPEEEQEFMQKIGFDYSEQWSSPTIPGLEGLTNEGQIVRL